MERETAVEQSGQVAVEESKSIRFSISSQKFGSETLEWGSNLRKWEGFFFFNGSYLEIS